MNFVFHPWHIVILALSALIDGERDKAIAYLLMENQVLREKLYHPHWVPKKLFRSFSRELVRRTEGIKNGSGKEEGAKVSVFDRILSSFSRVEKFR